ncbi:1,4-dihydroxy-2-naphthoate polyprenyltransferase [Peptococcaceae bacterium 1198_IL3148]
MQNNKRKDQKPSWQVWWRLLRPHTLTASFIPVSIGTALAIQYAKIDLLLFGAMLLACILIQAATNMFNEYYDYVRGLDTAESVGIGGTIVRDGVHPKVVLRLAMAFLVLATLFGGYICYQSSWWIALIGLVSMAVGYLYTGGPYPIAYTPLGELVSGFLMGTVITMISFFIQTGIVSWQSFIISVPILVLVGAIMMSNNIRDLEGDKAKGRRTLAILLGKESAIKFMAGMFIFSYLWVLILVVINYLSPWLLLVLLSVPKPIKAIGGFKNNNLPIKMMPAMRATAQTNTFFGFLLVMGLLISNMF